METYEVDVSTEEAIGDGYEQLMADFGRIDCVFANSGGPPGFDLVFDIPTDQWHKFLDVALHGAFFTLREGARHMVDRAEKGEPGGSLVACGSLSLFQGLPGKQNYAASKAAIAAVVRCMAVEFGEHAIRANIVAPGLVMIAHDGGRRREHEGTCRTFRAASAVEARWLSRRFRGYRSISVQRRLLVPDGSDDRHRRRQDDKPVSRSRG